MPDTLDTLTLDALRVECIKKGIHYPNGIDIHACCKHELISVLRSPEYNEAFRLGLIGKE